MDNIVFKYVYLRIILNRIVMKNKIKETIKRKGITQKELAGMIGMSEVGLSKAINGSASMETIIKVADAVGVEKESLIDNSMLVAKYGSDKTPLRLGNLEIPCYVLEDGTRVFSGRGIQKVLGSQSPSGAWLSRFITEGVLSEMFSAGENSIASKITNPIKFKRNNAGGSQSATNGFEVTLLIDICSTIIDANRAGIFNDEIIVRNADIIIRSVAKVGIIALVDEVTGYNKAKERAKDELQQFLKKFISDEASKWIKVFNDTFFEDLYKMHKWTWTDTNKHPGVVGRWINDIVYERLAPLIRKELEAKNPKNTNGNRSYKHHQFLTREIGLPKLKEHLEAVHAFAVLSDYDWCRFMRFMDKVYPHQYQQFEIDFDFDEISEQAENEA